MVLVGLVEPGVITADDVAVAVVDDPALDYGARPRVAADLGDSSCLRALGQFERVTDVFVGELGLELFGEVCDGDLPLPNLKAQALSAATQAY